MAREPGGRHRRTLPDPKGRPEGPEGWRAGRPTQWRPRLFVGGDLDGLFRRRYSLAIARTLYRESLFVDRVVTHRSTRFHPRRGPACASSPFSSSPFSRLAPPRVLGGSVFFPDYFHSSSRRGARRRSRRPSSCAPRAALRRAPPPVKRLRGRLLEEPRLRQRVVHRVPPDVTDQHRVFASDKSDSVRTSVSTFRGRCRRRRPTPGRRRGARETERREGRGRPRELRDARRRTGTERVRGAVLAEKRQDVVVACGKTCGEGGRVGRHSREKREKRVRRRSRGRVSERYYQRCAHGPWASVVSESLDVSSSPLQKLQGHGEEVQWSD